MTTGRLRRGVGFVSLALAMALAGCGGDDDEGGGSDKFVGQWQYASGTQTLTCPAPLQAASGTSQVTGGFSVAKGVDAALVMTDPAVNCPIRLNVSGNAATFLAGQSCTIMQQGVTAMLTIMTGQMVSTGATTANLNFSGGLSINVGGSQVPCTFTQTSTANKVSK